jgi:hypothetical protein
MTKPDKYSTDQWNRMNQSDSQQKLRKELRSALVRFLDTSAECDGYPFRMADILEMLRGYARADRIDGMNERLKCPAMDSQRVLVSDSVIGALTYAESQLRALEHYAAASSASTPDDEAMARIKKAQLLLREFSDDERNQYDMDWKWAMDEARESIE